MTVRALGIRWLAVAALGAATASVLRGQGAAVGGVVQDEAGRPLAGARVRVLGGDAVGAEVETDSAGRFRVMVTAQAAIAGAEGVRLAARRLGFAPDTVVVAGGGDAAPVALVLRRVAVPVPVVVVTGRRHLRGPLAGFYARRQRGQGRFFTFEEIDRMGTPRLSDLLRGVPGLRIEPRRGGRSTMRIRGAASPPLVWMDGAPLGTTELDFDAFDARTFAGVEVYAGPATVPPEFGGGQRTSTAGGTIVLWSREGVAGPPRRRRGAPSAFAVMAGMLERGELITADQADEPARPEAGETVAPLYPDSLLAARVAGATEVEFVVDAAGRVVPETFGVMWASHPAFGEAVRRAVVGRSFRPARRGGRAIPQLVRWPVRFDPQDGASVPPPP